MKPSAGHSFTAFGPGKIILLGEHGVVYGHPALAAPIERGVTATAKPAETCSLTLPPSLPASSRRLVREAFMTAAKELGLPKVRVALSSTLPVSVGLGSSGALAVACARVLLAAARRSPEPPPLAAVERLSFSMEQAFHGTPSGIDHTTSARRTLLYYRRQPAKGTATVRPVALGRPLSVIVLLSGQRAGTKETVAALRRRREQWPARYGRIFREIGRLVNEGRQALEAGDSVQLGDVMNMNHGLLCALGLSSPNIDEAVHRLRGLGALGAKLTGAGGNGGAVIGLFEDPSRALASLRRAGANCFGSRL